MFVGADAHIRPGVAPRKSLLLDRRRWQVEAVTDVENGFFALSVRNQRFLPALPGGEPAAAPRVKNAQHPPPLGEVARRSRDGEGGEWIFWPSQSEIKDFCQLSQRESLRLRRE